MKQQIRSKTLLIILLFFSSYALNQKYKSGTSYNIYGQIETRGLLDSSYFAYGVLERVSENDDEYNISWMFLNSMYEKTENNVYAFHDYEYPLWHAKWYQIDFGKTNSKNLKKFKGVMLLYLKKKTEYGNTLIDIYTGQTYDQISGSTLMYFAAKQIFRDVQIHRYEDHVFLSFSAGSKRMLLDPSSPGEIWSTSGKKYIEECLSKHVESVPVSTKSLTENMETLGYHQLAALQKINEAKKYQKHQPGIALQRLQVAYTYWSHPIVKDQLITLCKSLMDVPDFTGNWDNVLAHYIYFKLTNDYSVTIKQSFNNALSDAFVHYGEKEQLSYQSPVTINIPIKGSFWPDTVLQQDTLNKIAQIDFNTFLQPQIVSPVMRGLYHAYNYQNSSTKRKNKDCQFYLDALYTYLLYPELKKEFDFVYEQDIYQLLEGGKLLYTLKDHVEHGALDESTYHEACAIYCINHLWVYKPTEEDINNVSIARAKYSVILDALTEHFEYVKNPKTIERTQQYVAEMQPIFQKALIDKNTTAFKRLNQFLEGK